MLENKSLKRNKGITLIALVVTIIVLLILAGISIMMLTGENGILNRAAEAKEKIQIAKTEEEARLEYSNLILEKQIEGLGEIPDLTDVLGKLKEKGYEIIEEDDGKSYVKIGEYYYEIKLKDQQISIITEGKSQQLVRLPETAVSDKLELGHVWTKNGYRGDKITYLEKKGSSNRITVDEPIHMLQGDSVTVKQNSQYIFGYFIAKKNEKDGEYDYSDDPGWQTKITNQDITITATEECYIVINLKNTSNSNLSENDLESIKSLIIFNNKSNLPETLISDRLILGYIWGSTGYRVDETRYMVKSNNAGRVTMSEAIRMVQGDSIIVKQNTQYVFGYFITEKNKKDGYYDCEEDSGWQTKIANQNITITATKECYILMNWRNNSYSNLSEDDLENIKSLITFKDKSNTSNESTTTDYSTTQELLSKETTIETFTGCKVVTIPKILSNGTKVGPKVTITASKVGGTDIKSALTYAENNKKAVVINAGLFNTSTKIPQGQTIINGVSITNSPMTDDMGAAISEIECYPLCINEEGLLSAPYQRNIDTSDIINDGIKYAVTGWCTLIENGVAKHPDFNVVEIVHKNSNSRQVIGQYMNGDYFILTTTSADKSGMTYAQINEILLGLQKKVRFAYSLDGGGSAETVINRKQINTIYEGAKGRSVPTLIYFDE